MRKAQVSPVHVRFPPEDLEALRALAARRGSTVHAEVVRAVEALLADDDRDPAIGAIRAATLAMLAASHLGYSDLLSPAWVLGQFKANMQMLFDAMETEGEDDRTLTEKAARRAIEEMRPALIAAGLKFKEPSK